MNLHSQHNILFNQPYLMPNQVKNLALPQIEWVNIFIEPVNTPLSVIPAEAGIQCLLVPGRWIPAKNVQE